MVPVSKHGDRPPEDLTARARIRDAALAQFAERGYAGTTLKGIAEIAGFSIGLVQHHFGSKEDLRQACDTYARDTLGDLDSYGVTGGEINDPAFLAQMQHGPLMLVVRYVARAMVDGSSAAAEFFDSGADALEAFFSRTWPERFPPGSRRVRDAAAVMAAMHYSTLVLHEHIARRMGAEDDVLTAQGTQITARISPAILDVYLSMAEFASSETATAIRKAAEEHQTSTAASHENGPDDDHSD
jgi:TetR/AcrR family transcriptional regulator, regulator of cefoperazone and chloramphenicol sensitivity